MRRPLGSSRCPPAAWEAYLLVGVFPGGSAHAWTKAHVFVGRARAGRHCLSAVEALDGPGEAVVLSADADGIARHALPLDAASCRRARDGWTVSAPRIAWSGFPESRLVVDDPHVDARVTAGPVGWWARVPRVLSYASAFGEVTWRDPRGESRGLALLEHAWGADAPVDVAALAPGRWQWDVLREDGGGAHAALVVGGAGLRTMSRVAGATSIATGWRVRVRVRAWGEHDGRRVPLRWDGVLRTRAGTLHYTAHAETQVAPMVPGGGFLGTTWDGEWKDAAGTRDARGTGFTEYRAARPR